jgi:hypothetical protein
VSQIEDPVLSELWKQPERPSRSLWRLLRLAPGPIGSVSGRRPAIRLKAHVPNLSRYGPVARSLKIFNGLFSTVSLGHSLAYKDLNRGVKLCIAFRHPSSLFSQSFFRVDCGHFFVFSPIFVGFRSSSGSN